MATLKEKHYRKNVDGGYDLIHRETESDLVIRPDGTTVESAITGLNDEMTLLKTSVSSGKQKIASAVTDKGVSTAGTATFDVIAENISKIITLAAGTADATALATQLLSGYTAYVKGNKITGSMVNRGKVTSALNCGGSYTIPAGFHDGTGKISANSLASQTSATAAAADIAKDKTAWVNGTKITGTAVISQIKFGTSKGSSYGYVYHNAGFTPTGGLIVGLSCPNSTGWIIAAAKINNQYYNYYCYFDEVKYSDNSWGLTSDYFRIDSNGTLASSITYAYCVWA